MRPDQFAKARWLWVEAVVLDPAVSPLAVRCASLIAARFINRDLAIRHGELCAWPSQKTLATLVEATEAGVAKAMKTLIDRDHLHRKAGLGRGNTTRYLLRHVTESEVEAIRKHRLGGQETVNDGGGFGEPKSPTADQKKADGRFAKTPTGVGPTLLRDSVERNPASQEAEDALKRIWSALPDQPRERSNTALVREAIQAVRADDVSLRALALAVDRLYKACEIDATIKAGPVPGQEPEATPNIKPAAVATAPAQTKAGSKAGHVVDLAGEVFDAYLCADPSAAGFEPAVGCEYVENSSVWVMSLDDQGRARVKLNGQTAYVIAQRVHVNCQGTAASIASFWSKKSQRYDYSTCPWDVAQ